VTEAKAVQRNTFSGALLIFFVTLDDASARRKALSIHT